MQGQVVRAIAAFVAVIPRRPFPLSPLQVYGSHVDLKFNAAFSYQSLGFGDC